MAALHCKLCPLICVIYALQATVKNCEVTAYRIRLNVVETAVPQRIFVHKKKIILQKYMWLHLWWQVHSKFIAQQIILKWKSHFCCNALTHYTSKTSLRGFIYFSISSACLILDTYKIKYEECNFDHWTDVNEKSSFLKMILFYWYHYSSIFPLAVSISCMSSLNSNSWRCV